MPVNVLGFQTHRDNFAIDFDKDKITKRFQELRENNLSNEDYTTKYDIKDNRDWKLNRVRQSIRLDDQWQNKITTCLYRPFDQRYCYYSDLIMDRPRRELIDHVLGKENLCLLSSRQQATLGYRHCWLSDQPANDCVISTTSREANQVFPLYLYPTNTPTLFETEPTNSPNGRRPNLAPEFIKELSAKLDLEFISDGKGDEKKTFGPEDIFNYIYAVFHSPQYRQRYAEFLKIDFPRVPLTSNQELFWELVKKGDRLVHLHLMKATGKEISSYPVAGSNLVEQVKYDENKQQISINSDQYFAGIPPQIWNFYIGGYQVCQKWLKDRKGRHLSYDDLEHYQQIISILGESIAIMETIDIIINKYGGFPFS
jgi:predicted helicase